MMQKYRQGFAVAEKTELCDRRRRGGVVEADRIEQNKLRILLTLRSLHPSGSTRILLWQCV